MSLVLFITGSLLITGSCLVAIMQSVRDGTFFLLDL